jgi:predicted hydrocarbon binding protein
MRPELQALLARGKERGCVTWEEVNAAICDDDSGSLAGVLEALEDAGVEIVDAVEAGEGEEDS